VKIIAGISIVCIHILYCQEVRFFKEDVTMSITKEYFTVDGYYWFSNTTDSKIEKVILYPFGVTDKNERIDSAGLFNMTEGINEQLLNKTNSGFYFVLTLNANDTAVYRISYRQRLQSDSVRYILRSTQQWKNPLVSAEYRLIVNNPITITHYSIPPDTLYVVDDRKIYYWKRVEFMPEQDLVFRFRER